MEQGKKCLLILLPKVGKKVPREIVDAFISSDKWRIFCVNNKKQHGYLAHSINAITERNPKCVIFADGELVPPMLRNLMIDAIGKSNLIEGDFTSTAVMMRFLMSEETPA